MPVCPAAISAAPDAIEPAPLPGTARHQPPPQIKGDKPGKRTFKIYPIGFFHLGITELRTGEGKLYLFVAIDRTSKFAIARLAEIADRQSAVAFLDAVIEVVPYRIHTVLTDNGI